ncbi:aldo/keto reductase [Streptomyces sp. NPDC047023]|uniref:aldo/keto reductase n=1 Tax=Streptomyces sp. NPDC047023 TaxID=3155139 RepID=UPI0033FE740B
MTADDLAARHLCPGILTHPLGLHCNVVADGASAGGPTGTDRFLAVLHRAVAQGATFVDTSDSYGNGHSERVIGRLLRTRPDLRLHLSSKVGQVRGSAEHPYAGRHIHHQLEQSLDNLYAEQLHLYTLDSFDFGPGDRYLGNAIETMHTLRDVESIKAIGMRGPFARYGASPEEWAAQADRFLHLFRLIKPDVVWATFNAFTPVVSLDGEDLFTFTARHGVGLVLGSPLAHGMLAGKAISRTAPSPGFTATAQPFMGRIEEDLHSLRVAFGDAPGTLMRLALRSSLQRGEQCVVVVGFTDEGQIDETYGCLGRPLTPLELSVVDGVYASLRAHLEGPGELSGQALPG